MRAVVVPGTLALLPEYASIDDPIGDLRQHVHEAIAWLLEDGGARVLAGTPAGERIGRHLLGDAADGPGLLVVANGSAKRTEKAPGHLDDRAVGFDDALGRALRAGDSAALSGIDETLAQELWAEVGGFVSLGSELDLGDAEIHVDHDDAPYGVQYWVVRYACGS